MPTFFPCLSRRAAKRGVSSKSSASSPGLNTVSSDSTVHPVEPRRASRSSLQSFRLSLISQKRAKTDAMETPPDSGQRTHPQACLASPSSPSSASPSSPSPSSSSPPVEGRLRSDASAAGSLPACVACLGSQVGPLVSFPSLQRQQTEQLVKSLDFHVYLWGLNDKGQILNGAFGVASPATPAGRDIDQERGRATDSGCEREGAREVPLTSGPSRVKKLQHKTIAGMSCSAANTFIWDFHDLLWAGGSTEIGLELLGMDLDDEGRDEGVVPRASLCETLGDVKMVAASRTHAVAVLENGGKCSGNKAVLLRKTEREKSF
ncbi:UNVERIFIED_CONTAM: HECT-domain (ubiquitin-transferase) domain protein [Hammondia hammondi]|eukprot:XP_008886184.1 HECT-domain (ubiquitin-transferase) domain protein [Hammondia hammondi]